MLQTRSVVFMWDQFDERIHELHPWNYNHTFGGPINNKDNTGEDKSIHFCAFSIQRILNEANILDDIFKCVFVKENALILIKMSLKSVPRGPSVHKSSLVQVMARIPTSCKSLHDTSLTKEFDTIQPSEAICRHWSFIIGWDDGYSPASYFWQQCWRIVNLTFMSGLKWNFNQNMTNLT